MMEKLDIGCFRLQGVQILPLPRKEAHQSGRQHPVIPVLGEHIH